MKFKVEYAKSGYSICQACKLKIGIRMLRLGTVYQADQYDGLYEAWNHIECFYDGETEKPTCLDEIEGIQKIRYDDQLLIIRKINATPIDFGSPTKRARLDNSNHNLDADIMPIIASQNEQYYRIYDAMNEKNALVPERQKKQMLMDILDLNNQAKPQRRRTSTQDVLAHVVDTITFGAIAVCSECSKPGYIFDDTYGYVCHSRSHNGVKCNNREQSPKRYECRIPEYVKDIYPILHEPRFPMIRMLYKLIPPENPLVGVMSSEADRNGNDADVPPTTMKVASGKEVLKYGTVVDALSGIENEAHVYSSESVDYAVILSKTNIQENKNSFYKLQVLESDDYEKYWFFVHYGRIGISGSNKLTECASLQNALDMFNEKYTILTDQAFGFEIYDIPFKYKRLEIDYSDEIDNAKLLSENDVPSTLPQSVQQLIEMCFDTHVMRDTMIELQLDVGKVPLGKLSKYQIGMGFEVLVEIWHAVVNGAHHSEFIGLSNRFYTLIPHDFGPNPPPTINDSNRLSERLEMLANLSDIELAYSLRSNNNATKSAIDNCYDKLNANIESLDKSCELFLFLKRYVSRTHAPTHNFELIIEDIFKVTRDGEADRYKPFENADNRYLLWHGSRITNFVGILKNGLKIAPVQAERTGDMFGNGIYFSDVVTKSAQYCRVDRSDRYGLLLLCEVALGEIEHRLEGLTSPRSALTGNSVKGCGQTFPNPKENVVLGGVIVPCGNMITDCRIQSKLLYNEYVVYDESKVNIKFLFKVKFQRKRSES